jgi:glycerol-3-phosphate dehydrogenase
MAEQAVDRIESYLGRSHSACVTADRPLLEPREIEGVSANVPRPVTQRAVEHYCEREWAVHLDDVMVRRAGWHYYLREPFRTAVDVAEWMAQSLRWTPETRQQELERYRAMAESEKASAVGR